MENLAGKVLFLFALEKPGKAPPLSAQLLPLMLVSLASGLVLAQVRIKSVKKNDRYRQNCCRELFSHQKRKAVPD